MTIESLHIGMQVRHAEYGIGTVKSLQARTAEVNFNSGIRTLDPQISQLEPAEPEVEVKGLNRPLRGLIQEICASFAQGLGLEKEASEVKELGARWQGGKLVLHPADPTLQTKEMPLEVWFHKIVMLRNNLRVLEQKINAHPGLSDGEKVEMQQYITRSYGSLTTFNLLFKDKEGQFRSK